ncbi:hypothetical protein GCM10023115_55440 [Pontixanthobacter gangjinensis]|uniref:Glycerophosphoryl diester phosphodiesterase membrane domain-containing protein n=1 Tax=Pontixanthobacter gangjinensis TaxID=1028742 RepID=A0A6I4SPT1_9SPHN|nr:hypothetical protein [Pontixanthobacter gangjinensis]MXO57825.1 hypothetical protein [Pontixanthobacter gangjinensis]
MTFDMGRAWNDAVKILAANKDVLAIVAGVFFFLPSLALSILAPGTELEAAAGDPDRMQAALIAYASQFGWLFAMYVIATTVGTLTLYALLGRHHRPNVGEAIKIGFTALLPFFASSLIVGMSFVVLFLLVGLLAGATGSSAVGIILGIALVGLFVFVSFRLILVGPIMAIEGIYNPVAAISRSWSLIKGNTRYIIAFVILVVLAMIIVGAVLGMMFALVGALMGATAALWVNAILSGLLSAVMSVIMLSIYCAIHQQLAGGTSQADLETFE